MLKNGKKSSTPVSKNASEFGQDDTPPPPSAPPRDLLSDSESIGKVSKSEFELEENNEGGEKVN